MVFLSYPELKQRGIRYDRSNLWRMERAGKFPKRVQISDHRIGWIADEIDAWMQERANARNNAA